MRTRSIIFMLVLLLIFGYGLGIVHNRWYENTGNSYFHLAGGFFIALFILSYYASEFRKLSQPFRFFCIVGLTALVGVLWEFHEFVIGHILTYPLQGDLTDTIFDLAMDTLGAITATLTKRFFIG